MDVTALALFAFATSIAAGPNTVMLWASGMNFGVRRTLPHLVGVNVGLGSLLFAVSVGLGVVFQRYSGIEELLKVVGSLYLLYLAVRIATSARATAQAQAASPISFWEAVVFQYVNPKAWVISISAVGAFLPSGSSVIATSAALTALYVGIHLPSVAAWVVAGTAIGKLLTDDRRRRIVNRVLGVLLAATVVLLWV